MKKVLKENENKLILNISDLQKGMYFVVLNTFKSNSIQKIIKN